MTDRLRKFWCSWFHGGGNIGRDPLGRLNWQCLQCNRWSIPVPLEEEEASTRMAIVRAAAQIGGWEMSKHTPHTPGPWAVARDAYIIPADHARRPIGAHVDPIVDRAEYANVICTMETRYGTQPANARLIAAAPDLLQSLQQLLDANDSSVLYSDGNWEQARAAIARATGGGK